MTTLHASSREIYDAVDELTARFSQTLVPLYISKEHHRRVAQPVGTAFVAGFGGLPFLTTAVHVLRSVGSGAPLVARVAEQSILLNGTGFHVDEENDVAATRLNSEFAVKTGLGAKTFSSISVDEPSPCTPLGVFVMLGFPASQNVISPSTGKTSTKLVGFSFFEEVLQPKSESKLPNPLVLRYRPKHSLNSAGKPINAPGLEGTSGGPVVELALNPPGSRSKFKPVFRGVLSEYHKVSSEVFVVRCDPVRAVLWAASVADREK